jgi:hypothetical protein
MNLGKLFAGWGFRTRTPEYSPGDELEAYVTGRDGSGVSVRIGDTVISLPDGDESLIEQRIRFRVESFDASTSRGEGVLLQTVDRDDGRR